MKQVTPVWGQDYDRGFVGFSNCPGNILSKGITWFENLEESMKYGADLLDGGISHVFLVWSEEWGIESAEDGVKFFPLKARIDNPNLRIVFREPAKMGQMYLHQLLTAARAEEGRPYDYTGLVGYIFKVISPLHHIIPALNKLPVPLHVAGQFCSAYVSYCEKATDLYKDLQLFKDYHVTRISPNLLWNWFPWKPLRYDKERKEELCQSG